MFTRKNGINEMQFGFVEHPTHRSRAMIKTGLKYAITVTVHLLTAHMVQRC